MEKLAPCSSTLPPTPRKDVMSVRSFATVTLDAASSKAPLWPGTETVAVAVRLTSQVYIAR
eukprot:3535344-Prorocentrum_lima.AAC.1